MSEKPKSNGKRNYNDLLIWAAALVTVIRYAAAFVASDMPQITGVLSEVVTIFLGISGLGMGILDVIGGAYLFQGWRLAMPRVDAKQWPNKFKALTFFVFGLVLNGIVIIVPFTVSRIMQESMNGVLVGLGSSGWGVWAWAASVAIAPYMLIGGISTAANIVTSSNPATNNTPNQTPNESEPETNDSRKFANLSETEKLFIINSDSKSAALELGVTARAIQKWRKKIHDEMKPKP